MYAQNWWINVQLVYRCYCHGTDMTIFSQMRPWKNGCYFAGHAAGPWFNIKMLSNHYRKSHCGDKTVVRSSYLHNGISYTGKMSSLYWIGAQMTYSDEVLWSEIAVLRLKFHGSLLLLRVQLTISQHWLMLWLGASSVPSHYLKQMSKWAIKFNGLSGDSGQLGPYYLKPGGKRYEACSKPSLGTMS